MGSWIAIAGSRQGRTGDRDYNPRPHRQTLPRTEIITLAEVTARCGIFATELRTIVGHTRFDVWFAERGFDCSLAQAKAFMRFADRRQELSDSFRRTLLALPGVADGATRDDGSQQRLPKAECQWLSLIMKTQEAINVAKEHEPLEDWPQAHLITLQDALRPLVELHRKVEALCAD